VAQKSLYEQMQENAAQSRAASDAVQGALSATWRKNDSENDSSRFIDAAMRREYAKDALARTQYLAANAAAESTQIDPAAHREMARNVDVRNKALNVKRQFADRDFNARAGMDARAGDWQSAVLAGMSMRDSGYGDSAAALRGKAAGGAAARSMFGHGGGALAARNAMMGNVSAARSVADDVAQARAREAQMASGDVLSTSMAMHRGSAGMQGQLTGRDAARQELLDSDMFLQGDLARSAAEANARGTDAMRARMHRGYLQQMGDKQALAAQELNERGARIQAASAAGSMAFNAGASAIAGYLKKGDDK
jgi:hypothetical protein